MRVRGKFSSRNIFHFSSPSSKCFPFQSHNFLISVQPEVESVPAGGSLVVQAGAPVTLKCKVGGARGGVVGIGCGHCGGNGDRGHGGCGGHRDHGHGPPEVQGE